MSKKQMQQRNVVIVGATSAIAEAIARQYAIRHARFLLVSRNESRLKQIAEDLLARGATQTEIMALDFSTPDFFADLVKTAKGLFQQIDALILAHGDLGDHPRALNDPGYCRALLETNFVSYAQLLIAFSNVMKEQKTGNIVVFSSVAGDRGRRSNFIYGSAKAGVSAFASGLRAELSDHGIHVITLKPGPVDTPMTANMKKGPLFAKADFVGEQAFDAICRGKNEVYIPSFWLYIMFVIKHLPEVIFKRLKF